MAGWREVPIREAMIVRAVTEIHGSVSFVSISPREVMCSSNSLAGSPPRLE